MRFLYLSPGIYLTYCMEYVSVKIFIMNRFLEKIIVVIYIY